ncbi:MAG: RNA polymerase sigma factor [Pseudomonadales bacterium]|nr:RNA polymerase sigma factor [Pseudomonadales bacterium]
MNNIVKLFQRQDRKQDRFIELLRPHVELMYRMAFRWTNRQADAEEIVQETLIKLARRLEEMEKIENLRAWLIKILYHSFVDQYRRANRRLEMPEIDLRLPTIPESSAEDSLIQSFADRASMDPSRHVSLQMSLQKAIGQLDAYQRDVLLLHDAEGYSDSEIAEILDISKGTVKSRLHRTRKKMKELLTADAPHQAFRSQPLQTRARIPMRQTLSHVL